jgi:folate-binding protein YgfZ
MERSHEARLRITGSDRLEFIQRICTNDLNNMAEGEGRGVVFTKANARIIDRISVFNLEKEVLVLTHPGRGLGIKNYLQRNIFFNDDAQLLDLEGNHFVVHGPKADEIIQRLGVKTDDIAPQHGITLEIKGGDTFVARRKRLMDTAWSVITFDPDQSLTVWNMLCESGATPAGALAFNMLRIESGEPAFGREISGDYIPLEVGLWDEVSFSKGCYTGQEIIARMESRARLARVMVRVALTDALEAPQELRLEDRPVGTLTSSVTNATGEHVGIAVVKTALANSKPTLTTDSGTGVKIIDLAGAQPPPHMLGI